MNELNKLKEEINLINQRVELLGERIEQASSEFRKSGKLGKKEQLKQIKKFEAFALQCFKEDACLTDFRDRLIKYMDKNGIIQLLEILPNAKEKKTG